MAKIQTTIEVSPRIAGSFKERNWSIGYTFQDKGEVFITIDPGHKHTQTLILNSFEEFEEFHRDITIAYNHFREDIRNKFKPTTYEFSLKDQEEEAK